MLSDLLLDRGPVEPPDVHRFLHGDRGGQLLMPDLPRLQRRQERLELAAGRDRSGEVAPFRGRVRGSRWEAEDCFFTPRKPNLNLRTILPAPAAGNIEVVFEAPRDAVPRRSKSRGLSMAKAALPVRPLQKKTSA